MHLLHELLWNLVEDQHPLKQGLKLHSGTGRIGDNEKVEDQHPLKQGLKLAQQSTPINKPSPRRRPTSTKTRIETI